MKFFVGYLVFIFFFSLACYASEVDPLTDDELNSSNRYLKFESDKPERFIFYRGFVVQYNLLKKAPNFTIHSLSPNQISQDYGVKAKRRSNFFVDDVNLHDNSALNSDYRKSGYDKGHMVPAGDFYWNKLLKNETFVLTNITPQNPALNRGIWASLESVIRGKVASLLEEAYVITGAIYSKDNGEYIGRNKVGVPLNLYKIIYFPHSEIMYAFLFDNSVSEFWGNLSQFQVKVDDIELITSEDFFDKLDDKKEDSLEGLLLLLK